MSMTTQEHPAAAPLSTEDSLGQWREAERAASVARRGRLAAQAALEAANEAARSAQATAEAARAALASMRLAEETAATTARAARLVAEGSRGELADAETDVAMSDLAETQAHDVYRAAVVRAADRSANRM